MIHNYTTIVALASSIFASGCAGISGLGGTSSFACKAPDGVRCDSLLGIYHNSLAHNLPGQRNGTRGPGVQHGDEKMQAVANRIMSEYPPHVVATQDVLGKPIRSQSTTLRIWFAPYQDSDGDLNDASYAYVVTGQGEWMVDHSLPLLKDMPRGSATSKPTSAPKELVKPKTVSTNAPAFARNVEPPRQLPPAPTVREQLATGGGATSYPISKDFYGANKGGESARATDGILTMPPGLDGKEAQKDFYAR